MLCERLSELLLELLLERRLSHEDWRVERFEEEELLLWLFSEERSRVLVVRREGVLEVFAVRVLCDG